MLLLPSPVHQRYPQTDEVRAREQGGIFNNTQWQRRRQFHWDARRNFHAHQRGGELFELKFAADDTENN